MFNDIAYLCEITVSYDDVGNTIETIKKTQVFVKPQSIRMKEFYQLAEVGMKADFTLVLADYYDYHDEKIVEYNGTMYDVVRTYRRENRLEIVVTEREGRK